MDKKVLLPTMKAVNGIENGKNLLLLHALWYIRVSDIIPVLELKAGFFLDISKKTQGQKNSSRKKLKHIFEKLKQIIQKLNNLPTKN